MYAITTDLIPAQVAALDRACATLGFSDAEAIEFEHNLLIADPEAREALLCAVDREYFIRHYCRIYDPEAQDWIPFDLWDAQVQVLEIILKHQKMLALKARQLGLTWLVLAYALHEMIFRPISEVLIFSKREDEALYLLGNERLRGMYMHLPDWMKPGILIDRAGHFKLANGSSARAFPSNAGDSYTATLAIIDEADLVPNLQDLLNRVKPTVEAGGKLIMISRADKSKPLSTFKAIYRAAKKLMNDWVSVFLPWHVHPGRDKAWYDRQCRDAMENEGTLDSVHEQYPATDEEALSPSTLDKRIPPPWLTHCYEELKPIPKDDLPAIIGTIPDICVYRLPEPGRRYAGGLDFAEGLKTSDDSATTFIDAETGEEVCNHVGKYTPEVQAAYAARIARWFNNAKLMPERNNHGHSGILWLNENGHSSLIGKGHDKRPGWNNTTLGKVILYDAMAEAAKNQAVIIHDLDTLTQIKGIEKSTLRAPEGEMDDRADSYGLAIQGARARVEHGRIVVLSRGK